MERGWEGCVRTLVKKTERKNAKEMAPRQNRPTKRKTIHVAVCTTNILMTAVHMIVMSVNCTSAESHHEV